VNPLLPKNFAIFEKSENLSNVPTKVGEIENVDLWYMKDDKFERPKAFIRAKIYTPDCNLGKNPRGMVFAEVWQKVFEEYVREFCYNGSMAELNFDITIRRHGIEFAWKGYNDSMPTFVQGLVEKIVSLNKANDIE
jgi:secreted Zn-dependent insulinase-like peptidase